MVAHVEAGWVGEEAIPRKSNTHRYLCPHVYNMEPVSHTPQIRTKGSSDYCTLTDLNRGLKPASGLSLILMLCMRNTVCPSSLPIGT